MFSNHRTVSGSALSPARNKVLKLVKSKFLINSPLGSSLFIALKAVGAVKRTLTLYSDIILQKVLASGVPIGFPSNSIVVQP